MSAEAAVADGDLLIRVEGAVGRVTLNRPKALNALTHEMAMALEEALLAWRNDDAVAMVLVDGAGEKAFCAGGDIQALYETGRAGDFAYGQRFWADEYRLNALIANYPKPYVALMDGIVMGGGVGVSAHGSHRLVTERTVLAMPECSIGLVPDVGGSFLLARAPGRLGDYLGLSGTRIGAADAVLTGFADAYLPVERLAALTATLIETADPAAIDEFHSPPPEGDLAGLRGAIDAAFSADGLAAIVERLTSDGGEWAHKAAKAISRNSPLSLACTHALIAGARGLSRIEEALAMEYRFSSRCMEHGDFLEGVRAAIIDKDRKPAWRHASIEAVGADEVERMLAPAEGGDLKL